LSRSRSPDEAKAKSGEFAAHSIPDCASLHPGYALKRGLSHQGASLIEVMVDSAVPLLYAHKN
jgi:hypothetical protein